MTLTVLVTQLVRAYAADTAPEGEGCDIAAGLIDPNVSDWLRDVAAAVAAPVAPAASTPSKEVLTDAIAAGLRDTYHCTRVWSAWGVGTMSEDDFSPVDESDTPAELADAVLALFASAPPNVPPGWAMVPLLPTHAMLKAAVPEEVSIVYGASAMADARAHYAAMLAAAPKAQT